MEGIGKLTYKLSQTNILNKVTLEYQYTCSMMENTMHIHTCAYFIYLFIYKCIYPVHKQMSPKEIRSIMDGHALKR